MPASRKPTFENDLSNIVVTSYTNPGTAGGSFFYATIGGIKKFWGTTVGLSVAGASFQSNLYGVTFPTSFFTTIQSAQASAGGFVNTQYLFAGVNTCTTTSAGLYVMQVNGTNGSASIYFEVTGT